MYCNIVHRTGSVSGLDSLKFQQNLAHSLGIKTTLLITLASMRNIYPDRIAGFIHDSGQPTVHYNVLKYSGIDSRRVIIDERAPLYFVGLEDSYAPMLFLVADNDMENRYEQTMLTLSTLKHFRYDMSKVKFKLMHGKHCEHCSAKENDGTSVFGRVIFDFLSEVIYEDTVDRK